MNTIQNNAAVSIQNFYRGYLARKTFKNQRDATLTLQAALRTFLAQRNAFSVLPFDLEEKGVALIGRQNLTSLPRAPCGKTPVYLPEGVPIVLKHAKQDCSIRLTKMKKARELCHQHRLNRLVIPQANIYGEFLIEQRLPIVYHSSKEQMGLYYENRDQFTPAIQDLTRFVCLASLKDLSSGYDPFKAMRPPSSQYMPGRYDNVPLYINNDQYCIGLIDLERTADSASFGKKQDEEDYLSHFRDLIGLFPYHFEEIIAIGKQFWPELEKHLEDLKQYQAEAISFFEKFYINHRQFAEARQIERIDKDKLVPLDPKQFGLIYQSLLKKVASFGKEHPLGLILDDGIPKFLDERLEQILLQTTTWLEEFLKDQIELKPYNPSDLLGLLEVRTLPTKSFDLVNQIVTLFPASDLPRKEKRDAAATLLHSVLDLLVEQKILAFWQPLDPKGLGSRCYDQIVLC